MVDAAVGLPVPNEKIWAIPRLKAWSALSVKEAGNPGMPSTEPGRSPKLKRPPNRTWFSEVVARITVSSPNLRVCAPRILVRLSRISYRPVHPSCREHEVVIEQPEPLDPNLGPVRVEGVGGVVAVTRLQPQFIQQARMKGVRPTGDPGRGEGCHVEAARSSHEGLQVCIALVQVGAVEAEHELIPAHGVVIQTERVLPIVARVREHTRVLFEHLNRARRARQQLA